MKGSRAGERAKELNSFSSGEAKAAMASLYYYLKQHFQVSVHPLEEPTFFALEDKRECDGR